MFLFLFERVTYILKLDFSFQDRPLNLSCKQRKVSEGRPFSLSACNVDAKSNEIAFKPFKTGLNSAMEKAILQYQAQLLASSDILRVLTQRRLHENLDFGRSLFETSPVQHPLSSWLPPTRLLGFSQRAYNLSSSPLSATTHYGMTKTVGGRRFSLSPLPATPPTMTTPPGVDVQQQTPAPKAVNYTNFPLSSQSHELILHKTAPALRNVREMSTLNIEPISPSSQAFVTSTSPVSNENRKRKRSRRSEDRNGDKESFPCSICGVSYPHKFELNRHVKVSHVRPHRCGKCGKGFGHRNYLKVHIETVHLGQKSHQCRLCGKYLSTGGNLNVHVRTIHFGEKKYNCPICNRSFGQQCNMKTHMKRHYSKSDDLDTNDL